MKPAHRLRNRERLASAIAQHTTFTDVIRSFGLEPSGKRIALVRRLVVEYGLSTDHFGKLEGYGRYSRPQLEEAARETTSIAEMMRRLGMNPRFGSSHSALRHRLAELEIDTRHFVGAGWARNVPSNNRKRPDEILIRKPKGSRKMPSYMVRRALIDLGVPEICANCGQGLVWNGRPLKLQVDHKDGDNLNDEFENLQFLCPNCHSQTPTFGFRGKRPAGRGDHLESG
jgi:hypothetical protein